MTHPPRPHAMPAPPRPLATYTPAAAATAARLPLGAEVTYTGPAIEAPWTRRARSGPFTVLAHLPNGDVQVRDEASLLGWFACRADWLTPAARPTPPTRLAADTRPATGVTR